jgi:hypothetical protein
MNSIGKTQNIIEKENVDKFSAVQELIQGKENVKSKSSLGRISPQLSCTILPEDKAMLTSLTLYLSNKKQKLLNTSTLIRALIKLGYQHKDQLEL